jgi:outer membrane protein insertion porin family
MKRRTLPFLTLLIFAAGLAAQDTIIYDDLPVMDYANPREYIIADVTVSGIEFIQKEVLVSLSGLKRGNTIQLPGDAATDVLKKFWGQGLFSDAKITATQIRGDSIWLDIYLTEQPRMSRLEIHGISKSETQDVMEKINLKNGQQVTADIMDNTRRIIREHFIEKGFLNTDVEILLQEDTIRVNMVQMDVNVEKNDRVKINEIYFSGVTAFKESKLRRQMKDTKKVNINIFKASKLVSESFKDDKGKLIEFYNENGYRDAKVLSDSVALTPGMKNRLDLYINIEEGDKYYFGDIEWIGNTKYSSELLDAVLGIEKGDVFDQKVLDDRLFIDEDAVNGVYLDNGYLFFQLTPVEVSVEDDTIDFEMRIYEGEIATINKVIIKGNTRTSEHVVRRELRTLPGDKFSKSELIRTVRELANLGHFDPEQIEPNPIPNQADGTVDIEYNLTERATDQLEVSGGYGAGMLVATIGIRFSNFSIKRMLDLGAWRPVPSGDGQTLSVRAQTNGKYYQSYNFSFIEPWFGGKKPNSFSISVYHSKINQNYYSYWNPGDVPDEHMKVTGASLGLGRRLKWPDDFFTLYNAITYQRYKMKDYANFLAQNGTFNNISFTTTLGRNSQTQIIYPRGGSNISLSLQITPPYSLFHPEIDYAHADDAVKYKWVEYHRWMFKAAPLGIPGALQRRYRALSLRGVRFGRGRTFRVQPLRAGDHCPAWIPQRQPDPAKGDAEIGECLYQVHPGAEVPGFTQPLRNDLRTGLPRSGELLVCHRRIQSFRGQARGRRRGEGFPAHVRAPGDRLGLGFRPLSRIIRHQRIAVPLHHRPAILMISYFGTMFERSTAEETSE